MKNNIALVTGGSRGLGKNMAIAIAKKGLDVIITYKINKTKANETVEAIEALGQKAVAIQFDVIDFNNYASFFKTVQEALQYHFKTAKIHYIINNAGVSVYTPYAKTSVAQVDMLYDIHFKAPYLLTQYTLEILANGGGIINISTGLTRFSLEGFSAYAAMKGAIEVLTKYQAKELGSRQIRANTVAPGAIETDFGDGAVRDNPGMNQAIASQTALGRAGLPGDIGGVVAFLCTEEAKWVNAQRIEVSGGQSI